jgi:hypothetical protein
VVRQPVLRQDEREIMSAPWAIEMKSISVEEPEHLLRTLTSAIIDCGGWVVSRRSSHSGIVTMAFEFERQSCADIYCALIGAGLELSHSGHTRLTELCQCTRNRRRNCGDEIVMIELEIQTFTVGGMSADRIARTK